jgi:ADP-ribosylglycohydrolase
MGAPTEFLRVDEILKKFPPAGPTEPMGNPALVTDDTQMALAVGKSLVEATGTGALTPSSLEKALRRNFINWLNSPFNNRAPGMTCIQACERLESGLPWHEATEAGSKGCGANMRVAPVGLLKTGDDLRAAVAQFQAALTHGHPTALAASDLTAATVAYLRDDGDVGHLPDYLRGYVESQRAIYHQDWLGPLWQQPYADSPQAFIGRGWDECGASLDRLDCAIKAGERESDPCLATGAGWVAEEALATGLLCFLLFPDDPVAAIRRAAVSSGDSDSIACLTGAFAGARYGIEAWPPSWLERIEYRDHIAALAARWD